MCSNYTNHSRFSCEHNWEGLSDHLKRKWIFAFFWLLMTFASQFRFWNMFHDNLWFAIASQMRQFPIWFNGQIVCGVASAHNMATSLILTPLSMDLTRPTRIHQKCIWARSCSYYSWEPSLQSPAWLVRSLRINFISITCPQLHANGLFTFHRFFRIILMVWEVQVLTCCRGHSTVVVRF